MTQQQAKEFKDYVERQRYLKRCKWAMEMRALSEENLMKIPINAEIDNPLPGWARDVLDSKNMLSRRARVFLLRYHDFKIRQTRLRKAKGLL